MIWVQADTPRQVVNLSQFDPEAVNAGGAHRGAPRRELPGCGGLLALDHRADAVVGEDLEEQAVLDPAVDDVHALHAIAGGVEG